MGSLKVIEMNGQKTIDSRLVAEALEVRHTDLLRKISGYEEILLNAKLRSVEFFIPKPLNKTVTYFMRLDVI